MNNNINMFIISKVIETIVGKDIYNSELQELAATTKALAETLDTTDEFINYPVKNQIAFALGKGVAFIEKYAQSKSLLHSKMPKIEEISYKYIEKGIIIDHRQLLLDKVADAEEKAQEITMCAILDDTVESVFDLLWIQTMIQSNKYFIVNCIVNTAQVSINFSIHMLDQVLRNKNFKVLRDNLNKRFLITSARCPLISYQPNYFTKEMRTAIDKSDFVYIKGLNFFETCQIKEKDTFYAFVIYGPISELYTGLKNYDAVFVHIPIGQCGYYHNRDKSKIITLTQIVNQ